MAETADLASKREAHRQQSVFTPIRRAGSLAQKENYWTI